MQERNDEPQQKGKNKHKNNFNRKKRGNEKQPPPKGEEQ